MNNSENRNARTMEVGSPFTKSRKVVRSPMGTRSNSLDDQGTLPLFNNQLSTNNSNSPPKLINNPASNTTILQLSDAEMISNLQCQLQHALNEIQILRDQNATLQNRNLILNQSHEKETMQKKISYSPVNSEEEENLVERETESLLPKIRKNKKRKATESPDKSNNRPDKQTSKTTTAVKPPPVILSNVTDYNVVKDKVTPGNFECKTSMVNNT